MKTFFSKLSIFGELLNFLWKRKLWWLVPMIIIFFIFGSIVILVGSSPLAPIIYPLF